MIRSILAGVIIGVLVTGVAAAATGDAWSGTVSPLRLNSTGTQIYAAGNGGWHSGCSDCVTAFSGRKLSITLQDAGTGVSYVLRTTGTYEAAAGALDGDTFAYKATAKLYNATGAKVLCTGSAVAGGDAFRSWGLITTFPTSCPLRGTQFIQVGGGNNATTDPTDAEIWSQR